MSYGTTNAAPPAGAPSFAVQSGAGGQAETMTGMNRAASFLGSVKQHTHSEELFERFLDLLRKCVRRCANPPFLAFLSAC